MNPFSYNCKTGEIMWYDKRIVRFEKIADGLYFYIKDRGCKRYLVQIELVDLAVFLKWMIEQHNSDFGPDINRFAETYANMSRKAS